MSRSDSPTGCQLLGQRGWATLGSLCQQCNASSKRRACQWFLQGTPFQATWRLQENRWVATTSTGVADWSESRYTLVLYDMR